MTLLMVNPEADCIAAYTGERDIFTETGSRDSRKYEIAPIFEVFAR